MKHYALLLTLSFAVPAAAVAQEDFVETVEVTRTYDPTLPNAEKINLVPHIIHDTTQFVPQKLKYTLRTIKPLSEGYLLNPIPPARVQPDALSAPELFQAYVKFGLGFSTSTLFDAYAGGSSSSGTSWALYANHYGNYGAISNEREEKASNLNTRNDVGISIVKRFTRHHLAFNAGFAPHFVQYYGYDADSFSVKDYDRANADSVKGRYFKTYATLNFAGRSASSRWDYGAGFSAYDYRSQNSRSEDLLRFGAFAARVDSLWSLGASVSMPVYLRSAALAKHSHTHFSLAPYGTYRSGVWEASASLNLTIDKSDKARAFVLPSLHCAAILLDGIFAPYIEINGKYTANSFESLTAVNPYVSPFDTLNLQDTRSYDFALGIKGRYRALLSYKVWADYAILKNAAFFYNTADAMGNYFALLYDNGSRYSLNAQFMTSLSDFFTLSLSYRYQQYRLDTLEQPLHQPLHLLTAQARYNLWNKLLFSINAYVQDEYYALNPYQSGVYVQRPAGCDLSVNMEYRFFNHSSVFLYLNNILSMQSQPFNGYNPYGFNAMVGYAVKF